MNSKQYNFSAVLEFRMLLFCRIATFFLLFISTIVSHAVSFSYDSLNRLTNVNYGNGSIINYTYDAAGNRLTYSGVVVSDTTAPSISITSPTSSSNFTNTSATINLSGTASDNTGVTLVTWENYSGGFGDANGTNSWSVTDIPLQLGDNDIFVTAYDAAGNSAYATLIVTRPVPPPPIPQLTGVAISASGTTFQFNLNGPVGSNYVIQVSSNLVNWVNWITNVIPDGGVRGFAFPILPNQPTMFYRAVPWSQSASANTYAATLVRSSNQFFSAPDSPSLSVTGDMTIEAWVKLASQPSSGSYTIVSKSDENGNQQSFGLRYFNNSGVNVLDAWIGGNPPHATVAETIPIAQWTHIAMVYSASAGSITFYVNGVQVGATQTGLANSIPDSTAAFLISGYDEGNPLTLLDGKIDDVRVWGTALTQTQISSTMTNELTGSEPNLRAYWKLDNNLFDSTINGNTLLNNNSVTFENTDLPF
jgi:YD repeat-containing protein